MMPRTRIGRVMQTALLWVLCWSNSACTLWHATIHEEALQTHVRKLDAQNASERLAAYVSNLDGLLAQIQSATPPDGQNPDAWAAAKSRAQTSVETLIENGDLAILAMDNGFDPLSVLERLKNVRNALRRVGDLPLEEIRPFNALFAQPENALWKGEGDAAGEGVETLPEILTGHLLLPELRRRSDLFERKYFGTPEDESDGANFVEGWINSSLDLFRSEQLGGSRWGDTAGVSPWEATARIEPVISFDDSGAPGVLGAIGVTRHLFPGTGADPGGFWSDYVQRVGFRIGAGVVEEEGETADFIYGAALQVRSLTVWALINGEEGDVALGIGSGDFRWINELVTQFD